jgi:hypothetical protein
VRVVLSFTTLEGFSGAFDAEVAEYTEVAELN